MGPNYFRLLAKRVRDKSKVATGKEIIKPYKNNYLCYKVTLKSGVCSNTEGMD